MAARIRKINADTRTVYNVLVRDLLPAGAQISAIDCGPDGILYVCDRATHVVYKVYPDSRLAVLVGKIAIAGDVDDTGINTSTGLTARLDVPYGVTVDNSNNIWISDSGNYKIKRLSPSGRCVWAAGSGTPGDACNDDGRLAQFDLVYGICADKSGIIYMADLGNNKIKKMWSSGKVTSLAGATGAPGFANGNGANARFGAPCDVATDGKGNVYVADQSNHRIRLVDEAGNATTVAGSTIGYADGQGMAAKFSTPVKLCMDPASQALYVLDSGNSAIRRVEPGGRVTTFCAYEPNPNSRYRNDITMDRSGFLYVAEG